MEKLDQRERLLNEQFNHTLQQYRGSRHQLQALQEQYNRVAEAIFDRNNELDRILQELKEVKQVRAAGGSGKRAVKAVVPLCWFSLC